MGKLLIILGIALVVMGLGILFWDKLPFQKIPLGRLPGDIVLERPKFRLYFPWMTCLVISVILTILFSLFRK